MRKQKKESYFWTSYSDLMTSLFLVMLVLFVSFNIELSKKNKALEEANERINVENAKIKEILNSTKDLKNSKYFAYDNKYEKFILKIGVFFPRGESEITLLTDGCRDSLRNAGKEIKKFLDNHSENKYLLLVEGQASKDSEKYSKNNYELSFERAYSLINYWEKDCSIDFCENCEIQIAGSGDGALDKNSMRDSINELNQRFMIHVVPKNILNEKDENKK